MNNNFMDEAPCGITRRPTFSFRDTFILQPSMTPDKLWAHCRRCKCVQRFERVQTNHRLHAILTLCTVGIWGVSWLALAIGRRFAPWRCRQCGSNDPDLTQVRTERK